MSWLVLAVLALLELAGYLIGHSSGRAAERRRVRTLVEAELRELTPGAKVEWPPLVVPVGQPHPHSRGLRDGLERALMVIEEG